ncbi:His Kinase A domain containing protein [Haplosporangium sp. Z 11]|nr:His Kinase A domain containing protein [Haplosporangium sp. Z 11]
MPPFRPSTTSAASTSASSGHSRNSITETLKEHRWSKGLKLNWMPSFNSGRSGSGLEGAVPAPSPTASSSRSSVTQQKSVQRRKSEGTSLRISRTDQGVDSSIASPSLGLAPVSITGKSFSRSGKAGVETSVDQLKVSEARTRRISDSGLSTSSSKLSGTGLAERLSGFAATVRGLSRPSFTAGNSSPTMNSSSSCSTPTTPGFSPQCAFDPRSPYDQKYHLRNVTNPDAVNRDYESWDDFLYHYRLGQFPADCPLSRPRIGSPLPPTPPYVITEEHLSYMAAPLPANEERRLRALYSFQILQSGIDPNFERIVQLVATVMGVRGCMITLVDQDKVTVKAPYSHETPAVPRQESICGHTILRQPDDPFVVLDTKQDWRFQNLPSVISEPCIRFYAGAPLTTSEGLNVGALCLVDSTPRTTFTDKEKSLLIDFASVVMREMELWNDQVQLCIRNRMMRDVTRWVRGCLHIAKSDLSTGDEPAADENRQSGTHPLDTLQPPRPTSSGFSMLSSGSLTKTRETTTTEPALISPPIEPVFPTSSGSPTLLSCTLGSSNSTLKATPTASGNPLWDKAFPSACILIQATLNVDAVYLVQASSSQAVIPPTGSSIVWNYLDAAGRRKGSVGIVKGGQTLNDLPNTTLVCLASSQKNPETLSHPLLDEKVQHKKKQGSAWVCTDEGCRPHRIGDSLLNAIEPVWERDLPIIKEMLGYVRQEVPTPPRMPGQSRLFTCSHGQEVIENDWFGTSAPLPALKDHSRRRLLCHTFQGTLPSLSTGANTPYQSCVIVPISGPNMVQGNTSTDDEPWAYFVIMTASRTKQFTFHERIYLKNFGSCLVTEVMKRRVEAADKAKGTFIKSISHELRTPLHIILGILELLYANPEEPLSETQLGMVASAEASGKNLIDTINNIIDLAKLDPDSQNINGDRSSTPSPEEEEPLLEEVDIRELCERVAESMANTCTDKNLVVMPSWTKPSLSSLSSSVPVPSPVSASSIPAPRSIPVQCSNRIIPLSDEAINGYASSADSQSVFPLRKLRPDSKAVLELMVAVDEPENDPQQDTSWSFVLELKTITRILTQLVENAIKFTTTGFVEISTTSLVNSPIPMKPPHPDAKAILFTVRDTGKGISAEFVQSHLFKTFSQEDPLQVGTGLGMALVKELVKKLGGWMEVWSEGVDGKGCVVKVLIWASPASHPSKSLKDMAGPWQGMSCRFYAGETTVGSERLFKIMGERTMGQQLNMNVELGDEQDICAEDMFRDLSDQTPCNLLVFNDDLSRLKMYLSHWTDYHHSAKVDGVDELETPIPLLMLTGPPNVKAVQKLVDEYLETQIESNAIERPATIVIATKPLGPLKLVQCLRECFTPAFDRSPEASQSSPVIMASPGTTIKPSMIRSATVPHITTASLGVHDNRLLSAGSIIKQSFVFPQMPQGPGQRRPMAVIPPHSPGGLVIPPRILSVGSSPATTPEQESCPNHTPSSTSSLEDLTEAAASTSTKSAPNGIVNIEESRPSRSTAETPKLRPQRSIRNYQTQRQLQLSKATTTEGPVIDYDHPDGPLPRVLIVEDNLTNRMILRTFLKKRGIVVVEAENGLLGVQRFEEEVERRSGRAGFEFVLMDLQMPVLDGNEATRQIRQFEQKMVEARGLATPENTLGSNRSESGYRPTIIFALTGLAADEDKRLAFECGVDGYLTKPVSLKTLGSLLSSCQPAKTEGVISPAELQSSA